ncbi:YitT family protein [Robertkochia solimangrovi]|uniref:YitT family protein n=1 Tax=Robertkochia solimangrovi TaxID=2213046 RepID=UPI00117ED979|nr:YitT family protein [Robertkochia solimangrovi]TRZ45341.1 hypothetical protein DMZ48_06245 [Robertkochia solimangrovi]
MNPFFKQFIVDRVIKNYKKQQETGKKDQRSLRKQVDDRFIEVSHELTDFLYIFIGVTAASFGLKGFLLPSNFIDGGVTGISLIVSALSNASLSLLIFLFNLPFIGLAYFAISKRFAIKSILGILLLSLAVHFIPFPPITEDKILIAAFGGLFLGLGIGMAIRGGAIIDGTEVLAIYISRKSVLSVGSVILIFNLFIFLSAAYFLSTETALYAILTYFSASKTVDFVIDGVEEFMGITIISEKSDEIRKVIIEKMGRGCTIFKGQNGYAPNGMPLRDTNIVYTVITRLEYSNFKTEIDKVDRNAFMVTTTVKDTEGGMIKKKPINKIK